jgi:enamine deaminase RidA (YjgF/YER057c/UK114 family)
MATDFRALNPWSWQDAFSFSQAVDVRGATRQVLCSGQTSVDANGQPLHAGDMAAQLRQAFDNLEAVLAKGGLRLADIARLNFYVTDIPAFLAASEEVGRRFARTGRCPPAGTLLGVAQLFHPDLMIEMEATALA